MDLVDKFDTQIDAYILNSMSASEKSDFERLLNEHPVLQEELKLRSSLKRGIEQIEVSDVRNRLRNIKKTKTRTTAKSKINENNAQSNTIQVQSKGSMPWVKIFLLIVTLLALLVAVTTYTASTKEPNKSTVPMASYFEPMPLEITDRGTSDDAIKEMSELYNQKQYEQVIPYLDKFLAEKQDIKWNLYRGVSLYASGKHAEALEDFKKVANSDNYLLTDHGVWYQALTFLELGNTDTAKTLLNALASNPKADHTKEAAELLSRL